MLNPFFKNNGPLKISKILKSLNKNIDILDNDHEIRDIKDLFSSTINDITFFHSKKYNDVAKKTKASFCLTSQALKNILPKNCLPIVVDNVLVSTSKITSLFYPDSINDDYDDTVINVSESKFKNNVIYGKNVLIGKNVSIGKNCKIGHNTIIEKNVIIGDNCSIGSNNIIRNTLMKNNIRILDNCVIGKHGFGFFPIKK